MQSVELFVGAGGLALGSSRASFRHLLVADFNKHACGTIRENQRRRVAHVEDWPLREIDVRLLDYSDIPEGIDLLAGGPPCQPFSLGGKHRAHSDERDMFPEFARAVRIIRPKAILVENVRGLMRPGFAKYFSYLVLQLTYPEIAPKREEDWREHLSRLERYHTLGRPTGLHYQVVHRVLNAADYGVPQLRDRVLIVGFRSDLGVEWSFPQPTHSRDELLFDQWVSEKYWARHKISRNRRPALPVGLADKVMELSDLAIHIRKPWRTVRDAISDLPPPSRGDPRIPNHQFQPGARPYLGHTGSFYDWPAKTLKAGVHGVPGGENMLRLDDGTMRYFSVREAARLQAFPDEYIFAGAWSENMRQLGNAVPVTLAETVARNIRTQLASQCSRLIDLRV
ncbi:MAG: DNA cytosine methyltransferase [Candidatus Binataceae bacterium]